LSSPYSQASPRRLFRELEALERQASKNPVFRWRLRRLLLNAPRLKQPAFLWSVDHSFTRPLYRTAHSSQSYSPPWQKPGNRSLNGYRLESSTRKGSCSLLSQEPRNSV